MSYTIPGFDLSPEKKETYRRAAIEALLYRAESMLHIPRTELVVRDLSSEDVGLSSWATSKLENNWSTWFQDIINANVYIGIYKCLQLSLDPKVSSISFWRGGSRVGLFELETCYGGLPILRNLRKALLSPTTRKVLERLSGTEKARSVLGSQMEAFFSEPIVVGHGDHFRVELRAYEDAPPDYLVLGGFVVERHGVTVS